MAPVLRTPAEIFVRRELLSQAPELAVLAVLETALEVSVQVLLTEHPTLDDANTGSEPRSIQRARAVVASIASLQRAMGRYRAAVIATIVPASYDNDPLPF